MSKMSELSVLLGEIINTGSSLLKALTAVRELVASLEDKDLKVIDVPEQKAIEAPKPAAKAKAKKEEPTYTLETVREVLSRKSNIDGGQHRAEVKALVKKYGNGGTLKDVPAEQYAALIAEAEVMKYNQHHSLSGCIHFSQEALPLQFEPTSNFLLSQELLSHFPLRGK